MKVAKFLRPPTGTKLDQAFATMAELDITDVQAKPDLFTDRRFHKLVANAGIRPWLVVQTFYNDDNALTPDDSRWAILDDGSIARASGHGEWLSMVCPRNLAYQEHTINRALDILTAFPAHGVSLDFLRHFVFWEGVFEGTPAHSLPNSCFCSRCRAAFSQVTGISLPESAAEAAVLILEQHEDQWIRFKCDTITAFARRFSTALRNAHTGITINIHTVPWRQVDFNGALTRIAGQDLNDLGAIADLFTPMTYAGMLKRSPDWISSVVTDHFKQGGVPMVPVIQCEPMYDTGPIPDDEFRRCVDAALANPSAGIAIWPFESLTANQVEILKRATRGM